MSKRLLVALGLCLAVGLGAKQALSQASPSTLYVPLIGISSVPEPLSLPGGTGVVTYHYAVKNFLEESPLGNIHVADSNCLDVKFVEGDDNANGLLDASETWRYDCAVNLSVTTTSVATVTGTVSTILATDTATATVIVGDTDPAPLVSIVNITKVAYPLSLPKEGGDLSFVYRVNNPGVLPLSNVTVTDDKCGNMSGKLGDTNNNNLLDSHEVWVYTCNTHLQQTTTNTAQVSAYANGLQATDTFSLTVIVDSPSFQPRTDLALNIIPNFPDTGFKVSLWGILAGMLIALTVFLISRRKQPTKRTKTKRNKSLKTWAAVVGGVILAGALIWLAFDLVSIKSLQQEQQTELDAVTDKLFGWKYPVADFPNVGNDPQLAYSDIRDPGGIPEGLPVRLKIPAIGVNSAVEDALITPDGRMDVPQGSKNVAWFSLGPHPGQTGSAVIGGHYGINAGVPYVFYKLDQLEVGDKVYVDDDQNNQLIFVVRSIALFERDADATTVFTSNDGVAHLNLITCEGIWNQVNNNYPLRRVVFTTAITPEEITAGTPVLPYTALPPAEPTPEDLAALETQDAAAKPVMNNLKSLFATPLDTLITAFLLGSISFVSLMLILRRRKPLKI